MNTVYWVLVTLYIAGVPMFSAPLPSQEGCNTLRKAQELLHPEGYMQARCVRLNPEEGDNGSPDSPKRSGSEE